VISSVWYSSLRTDSIIIFLRPASPSMSEVTTLLPGWLMRNLSPASAAGWGVIRHSCS